ncbi:hypothetical protein [Microbacterium excoecariae]|uniref:hypothetical protein n=1 Tax=Microbacterium excoecariae TaxID=2715210 RepID=UPI0014098196|nr:hypothetical protein [Microbacterium excoecariae]
MRALTTLVLTGLEETPVPTQTVDPDLVTPGPLGFLIVALVVVAVVLLVIDMLRRVRRVRYREEVTQMLDAEEAAARAERPEGSAPDEERPSGDAGPTPR